MQWGKFIRLVPHPVMLGFVNGLAIVIFLAQMTQFKDPEDTTMWLQGAQLYSMLGLVALTMLIIWGLPKLTSIVPAPLAGIGVVALIVIGFGIDVPTVGDMASIKGNLPSFHNPFGEGVGIYGTALAPFNVSRLSIRPIAARITA